MIKTKLVNVGVLILLVSSVFFITGFPAKSVDKMITDETEATYSSEPLLKKTFLFGRVHNVSAEGEYYTGQASNLWIIFFKPFQFFHYTNGQTITFSNQYTGLVSKVFLMGSFHVVLPINTNSIAVMDTTKGTILVELYEDKMPITTANFIKLTNDGFYNGLVFHRVIEDFVIQGGGYYPNGTLKISPYGAIDLEISPDVHHLDGTIGMARTSDPDSATSQFFIDDGAQPHLEPNGSDPNGYAAFGRVLDGIDIVRTIAGVETTTKYGVMKDWPVNDIIITRITIVTP